MDIQQSSAGQILKLPQGYNAFMPNALPPKIEWDIAVIQSLSRADFLLGQLAREGGKLPNPHLLIQPFVTREAVLSSKIEGTQTTLGEMLVLNADSEIRQTSGDIQEVQNYVNALDDGLKRLKEFPLSLRLIREIHE